jgi:hypothetical protein
MPAISPAKRLAGLTALFAAICLSGCGKKDQPVFATLTMKDGGTHFVGTVVRQDKNSITLIGSDGSPRTFLFTELAGPIQYGSANSPDATASSGGVSSAGSSSTQGESTTNRPSASPPVEVAAGYSPRGDISFPAGTEFPVRVTGFLDSCCLPRGTMTLGRADADLKSPNGKIAVPAGSNIVFDIVETGKAGGQTTMVFRISAADFGGNHYIVDPGVEVTFTGPKEGTPAAKVQGLNIHLQDGALMNFKAVKPVTFHLSK